MCNNRAKRLTEGKGNRNQQSVQDSPKLVVLCGPSHAGKSCFARRHLKGCRIISTDRLRERLGVTFARYEPEPEVWKAFEAEKCRALREGVSVVLDACHMSEKARWHALQGPNARHSKVCIVFNVSLETIRRRCLKTGRVPPKEAERMWRAFQRSKPTAEQLRREGFNEVRFVRNRREERLTAARLAGRAGSGSAARVAGDGRPAPSVVRPACGRRFAAAWACWFRSPSRRVDGGRGWTAEACQRGRTPRRLPRYAAREQDLPAGITSRGLLGSLIKASVRAGVRPGGRSHYGDPRIKKTRR